MNLGPRKIQWTVVVLLYIFFIGEFSSLQRFLWARNNQNLFPHLIVLCRLRLWASSVVMSRFCRIWYMFCFQDVRCHSLHLLPSSSHSYTIFGIWVSFIVHRPRGKESSEVRKSQNKWKLLPEIEEITEGEAHKNTRKLYRDISTGSRNISIQFPCVFVCLSLGDLFIVHRYLNHLIHAYIHTYIY